MNRVVSREADAVSADAISSEIASAPPEKLASIETEITASQPLIYALGWERNALYARVNARVDAMIAGGADEEARTLREKWGDDAPFASGVGYRQLWAAFDAKMTRADAIEAWKRESRRYAKRQTTWFKHQIDAVWLDASRDVDDLAIQIERETELGAR